MDTGAVKRVAVCVMLLSMPNRSAVSAQVTRSEATAPLTEQPAVHAALEWFEKNLTWINDEQVRFSLQIPRRRSKRRSARS